MQIWWKIGIGFALITWGSGLARFLLLSHPSAVEICDNALDDDGDGLIDLNDPDCVCEEAKPVSLIPNPSFEEKNCCPQSRSELHCSETWIQASEATTDLLHTCGWMGWPNMPPPLPFPDGDACIGFRNGIYGSRISPNWKEYAGACLNGPMKAGTSYLIRFYIGFSRIEHSPPLDVVFYGTSDCANLPFGVGNSNHGCPMNGPGWIELGRVYAQGEFNWFQKEILLTPPVDIRAIAIGPGCDPVNTTFDTYYFLDHLVLADERDFGFTVAAMGNPCSDTFALRTISLPGRTYQWYKNGIALVGETQPVLRVKTGDGHYQARVSDDAGCRVTETYIFRKPFDQSLRNGYVCPEGTYNFHGKQLTRAGTYVDTLKSRQGCDSIVRLYLTGLKETVDTASARIFEGETYAIGTRKLTRPGRYPVTLKSSFGCDSLVVLDLDWYHVYFPSAFSPNGDGRNERFTLFGGSDLKRIRSLQVFDRWGGLMYQGTDLPPDDPSTGWDGTNRGKPMAPGLYVYKAVLLMDDGKERVFTKEVTLVR